MENLDQIADRIHTNFSAKNSARDAALEHSRFLIRSCANAIRAVHRGERELAAGYIAEARTLADKIRSELLPFPELYYAGYTQDAFKEFAEASIVYALIGGAPLPSPEELGVEYAAYLNGLGEAAGELRRRCLDILRNGHSAEAERLLDAMDDIYSLLVTIDYPDAITGGLRRTTDMVRGVTERTRGDLTISLRQYLLEKALRQAAAGGGAATADASGD